MSKRRRAVVLAEGTLDFHHGKTATSLLRYRPDEVVAVIDSVHAGRTTGDVLGLGGHIPIYADVAEALHLAPTELIIGIAPRGGGLPDSWRPQLLRAIAGGMDVVSGLHFMLNDDPTLAEVARQRGTRLVDLRRSPDDLEVARLAPRRAGSCVVTFVGSDCAVGKMTAAIEIAEEFKRRDLSVAFVATGQTGIMLEGSGVAVDRVIGDFMAGAVENLVVEAARRSDYVLVEGQGSLLHPGYSGVTLSLLHGSSPDAMILVHPPALKEIEGYGVKIPPLPELVRIYEDAAGWVKPARVAGIALNTRGMSEHAALRAVADTGPMTGLPVTDPVRFGAGVLVDALRASAKGGRDDG